MKYALRIAVSALLALALLAGCALAQTAEDVRAELGSCSVADYEGKTHHTYLADGAIPYEVAEYVKDAMLVWEIGWEYPAGGALDSYAQCWFPSRGIVADARYDMDGDGADEWLVLFTRDRVHEYLGVMAELWLSIYECSGDDLELSDSICLSDQWDYYSDFTRIFLMERSDGTPVLVHQDYHGVDDHDMVIWQLAYDGEEFSIHNGLEFNPWEGGYGPVILMGEGTSMDALLNISGFYPGDLKGDIYTCYDDTSFKLVLQDSNFFDLKVNQDKLGDDDMRAVLREFAAEMDLQIDDVDWDDAVCFYMTAHAASAKETILLQADSFTLDDSGHYVFRIERRLSGNTATTTGDVNLRSTPGLDGEAIGMIPANTTVAYLGEESVDERGVAWYRVRFGELEGWASSKFAQLD